MKHIDSGENEKNSVHVKKAKKNLAPLWKD